MNHSKDVHFMFDKDVVVLMKQAATAKDYECDALTLAKAATIVRNNMFKMK